MVNGSVVARNDEGQSLVTSVTRGGLRNIFILDNFSSSRELSFRYDLPEGTLFQQQSDGSIIVATEVEKKIVLPAEQKRVENAVKAIVGDPNNIDYSQLTDSQIDQLAAIPDPKSITVKAQEKIATISAPWAVDAQGKPVPTHYELQGNKLTQVVDATKDTTFPVTADPAWWWWVATTAHCVISAGLLFYSGAIKAAKLVQVLRAGKAGARIAQLVRVYGPRIANALVKWVINQNDPVFRDRGLRDTAKYIWSNAFNIVIDILGLGSCVSLLRKLIYG